MTKISSHFVRNSVNSRLASVDHFITRRFVGGYSNDIRFVATQSRYRLLVHSHDERIFAFHESLAFRRPFESSTSSWAAVPTATIELQCEEQPVVCDAAIGDGPIDAVFKALERIIEIFARLEDFNVRSISEGKDAMGEVRVKIDVMGRHYLGKGVSTDIIAAAACAYLQALNKADADRQVGATMPEERIPAKSP